MFRYLVLLIFFSFASAVLADPSGGDCPEGKSSPPQTDVSPSPSLPSTSPQEGATSPEPSTTKDQIGSTFDPSTMIPDKPIVEEKNPDRKRLLDKIYKAKMEEAEAKMRLDDLDRLQKDCYQRIDKIFDEDQNLFKKLDAVNGKAAKTEDWESKKKLYDERNKIWRELGINDARKDGIRKQAEGFHQETSKVIKKWGDAIDQQMGLEYSLEKMDVSQAAIPKPVQRSSDRSTMTQDDVDQGRLGR